MNKITLNTLLNFDFENDEERIAFNKYSNVLTEYYNDTQKKYYNGCYYFGGQIKMRPDDEWSLKLVEDVKNITIQRLIDYGGPCNSWEQASIYNAEQKLNEAENLIKTVCNIFSAREAMRSSTHKNQN